MVFGVLTPTELGQQSAYNVNGQFHDRDPHLSHIMSLLSERQNVYCYADSSPEKFDAPIEEQNSFEDMDAHDEESPPLHPEEVRPHTEIHIDSSDFVGEVPTVPDYFVQLRDCVDEKFTKLQEYVDERFTKIEKKLEDISTEVKTQQKNSSRDIVSANQYTSKSKRTKDV